MRFYPMMTRRRSAGWFSGSAAAPFSRSRLSRDAPRRNPRTNTANGRARIGAARHRYFEKTPAHSIPPDDIHSPVQRQLTLDLGTPPPATFDNFHAASNDELVTRLRALEGALAAGPVADRSFYVWGEPGSGRSHLLHALVYEASGRARYLSPQSALNAFGFDPEVALYAVDDCDRLSAPQQIALFNLFNEVRAHPTSALVATGNAAPMTLAVREDLRTRLGWGLVFHLLPLSDEAKASVLKHAARERGIVLAEDVPAYLLTHFRRDMPSLMALFDDLDRFSLEQKRAVTRSLLRTMLAQTGRVPPLVAVAPESPQASPDDGPNASPDDTDATPAAPDNDPSRFK